MGNALRFEFSEFFNCLIKKNTIRSQRHAVNMLLKGESDDFGINPLYDDSTCSNYVSGKRRILESDIIDIQGKSNEELIFRIKDLAIHSTKCLSTFFELVDSGYIEFDDLRIATYSRTPNTDEELQLLLVKLFQCAIECSSENNTKLSKEQIKKLQNGLPKEQEKINNDEQISYSNNFIDNYSKKMFWSSSDQTTLENLYVYNTYRILQHAKPSDDLKELIGAFLNGTLNDYLRANKGIQQYITANTLLITAFPGCGKTSLITKLSHDYAETPNIYFINMAELKKSVVTLATIADKIGITKAQLEGTTLILDSLDEAIKHSENCDEVLTNLTEEFEEYKIKALITCRSNLLTSNSLRSCLEIELLGFNSEKAIEWLSNYHCINPEFPFEQWKFTVSKLDSKLSEVLLIPLILYICVVREIDITTIRDIGQLYDILFDPLEGQVALSSHRAHANYKSKEWNVLRETVSNIAVIMYQKGYIDKSDIANDDMYDLKRYFGLDFYVNTYSEQFQFVHASMWQYFVAERIYQQLILLKNQDDVQLFLDNMLKIIVPHNTFDYLILGFIDYFSKRDHWTPADASLYKHILLHISEYNISKTGNILTMISSLWRDLFKIFTNIFKHYYPYMLDSFFEESFREKNSDILIRCSNLTDESPVKNISGYRLKNITLNKINFKKTTMRYCTLRFSTFKSANFDEASLSGIYADNCNMTGSSFVNATLHNANMNGSILIACDFSNAKLNGANFNDVDISYADLRNAVLHKTYFNNAIWSYCKISLQHLDTFNLELISANNISVYDENNNLMSKEQLYEYYYQKHPVELAFRKYAERNKT